MPAKSLWIFRHLGRLVAHFEHTFEYFKQYYTLFHILFYSHVYQKHPNNITQTPLLHTSRKSLNVLEPRNPKDLDLLFIKTVLVLV